MAKTEFPFRIGIVPIDGFALMSYAATVEPLRAANLLSGKVLYEVVNIQTEPAAAKSSGNAITPPQSSIHSSDGFDLVLVVAGGNAAEYQNQKLAAWLRALARKGTQIGGVSAGPLFLARIGLLGGYRMTVHWEHADFLQEFRPDLMLERSLYVIDRSRMTCGGGTAPMDMMLAMITNHHGQKLAQLVGDWFLHTSIRPPKGAQRASPVERYKTTNAFVLAAIKAMETYIAEPQSLRELANVAGTSPRQLTRLFVQNIGETPMAFARSLRLEKARGILATAPVSISQVALMTGFCSAAHFSSAYSKKYGAPPSVMKRLKSVNQLRDVNQTDK